MSKSKSTQLSLTILAFLFSLLTISQDFFIYYRNCGSLFPVSSKFTHPFYTPCFYGGFAFLLCLLLAFLVYKTQKDKFQKYLVTLAMFGTAFAYSNMIIEVKKYINAGMRTYKGCSGATVQNPFFTPCFIGSIFFTTILILSVFIYRKQKYQ